jgi:RHS repeat-associated protein
VIALASFQAIRTLTSPTAVAIHSVFDSEGRRIAEYNEGTGALIREYVWNGWEPVAVIEGGVVSFVRADHIGRPVFATNSSGVKVWSATYTPFGGVHVSTGTLPPNRFPGQWFQSESGLHQNWMRDYDPTTGRYLQPDPLGLIDGASVYGYAGQSPMMNMDPTGECFGPLIALAPACAGAVWGMVMYLAYEYIFDDGCWTWTGLLEAGVVGAIIPPFAKGAEYSFRGIRFAPFGNKWWFPSRGGKWWQRNWNSSNGKWPHYHRPRIKPGEKRPGPGQGKDRHRPWDSSPFDGSFWDRF